MRRLLALVHEGDPIPRADNNYVSRILDLYRDSAQNRPSINPDKDFIGSRGNFQLPSSRWYSFGYVKVMRDESEAWEEDSDVRAYSIDKESFKKLLYSDISSHWMDGYLELAEMLHAGRVNQKWEKS